MEMALKVNMEWLKEIKISEAYLPEDIQVGDIVDGQEIVEIRGSVFVVKCDH